MKAVASAFKPAHANDWTRDRVDKLSRQELLNLQANATRLGETELAAMCDSVLKERPKRGPTSNGAVLKIKGRSKLLPRSKALGARGVFLTDPRTSWSGVRKADGAVVMALWQAAVQTVDGGCACLLWSPNADGKRPFSDTAGGKERLEHCKLAMEKGGAEGLLVQGEPLEGHLPEDRARTVLGIDSETVVQFHVEKRGDEYWAIWGKKTAKA